MAKIFIEQYQKLGSDLVAKDNVAIGVASAQSAAFIGGFEKLVLVITSNVPCQFETGANPTADANSRFLPADLPRAIVGISGEKLAVIEKQ